MDALSDTVRYSLAAIFFLVSLAQLSATKVLKGFYQRWDIPAPRTVPVLFALSALFLLIPHTHVWGVTLAGLVLFAGIVAMLDRGHFAFAALGIAVLSALPIAILAGPTS